MKLPNLKIGNLMPRYPIIQGGMAVRISTSRLASAVAEAGGIGLIAATGMDKDELKKEIRLAREKTQGIIGINIMFAATKFKELVFTALDEGIDLIVQGAGFSRDIFSWCKDADTPFIPIVSTPKLAVISERLGAAAIVAEGKEAGGHLGTEDSMRDILPKVKKVVSIPVIAAGGIVDARDMQEAFSLGANGVQMGIRFAASKEANGSDNLKELYVKSTKEDIVLVDSPVGLMGRALRNEFTDKLLAGNIKEPQTCNGCLKKCKHNFCIMEALNNAQKGNLSEGLAFSGEYIDKITEILSAQEIINRLVQEYESF
ncbi:NAD(P)H-dependent flavin oxidoreductase YrpB, nitropropane dioxygenase family [Desulfonispora thiosulfatigenes DSM 11270]|uniref:Probable nitronate monooxygenase n=1 Tax=Desulfonispora thiosulfatigenes DSM 11270 TaxID=656914 RepID=A0A1W1VK85_DESTI|nr:nitronate monooxygenase [Desulfonispora thiosulfatigenes]SMB93630.1 NAD(P)H-dependent flavin oxidoreductase YrpB, nitropropane dioxygenase family [Desulfonispora thiosulfatigenes DSM 11270]